MKLPPVCLFRQSLLSFSSSRPVTCETRLFSSTFQAAPPPGTSGTPVFPDVSLEGPISDESSLRNSSPDSVFVVTGANRGIGLQFCQSLLERTQGTVVACCRSPENSDQLNSLQSTDRLVTIPLDLEDPTSIQLAATTIQQQFSQVDLLLNVAGILGDTKATPGPERALSQIDDAWFLKTLRVNLMGPVLWSQALAPLMEHRRKKSDEMTRPPAVVANLSARVGSISDNAMGGWYSYRISKAGLNQATRTMALEWKRKNVWTVSLHPGTTNTDLSKPFQGNVKEGKLFPVDFTVDQLLQVLDHMNEKHSGGFYDWSGQSISF